MLQITIPSVELWDGKNFVYTKEQTLQLEHSLMSISKWESKWCKSFFSKEDKTNEETIDYIRCMTLTQNVDPKVYRYLTNDNVVTVKKYIDAPMTAARITQQRKGGGGSSGKLVTSDLIYYWMTVYNVPFECQKWHLNRLLTLLKICEEESKPKKKMSLREIMARNNAQNDALRRQWNSKG